jgi:glycosyltransferase involved in cell wall biosynthesis
MGIAHFPVLAKSSCRLTAYNPIAEILLTGLTQKMRILMYSTYFPPQYSGAAKQALSLAKHLRKRGHDIDFVTVKWPGLKEQDVVDGFPVWRIEEGRGRRHRELRLWWNLLRFAYKRRRDFNSIHSHGAYYTNSIVGPLAKMVGWKSLVKASLANNDLHGIGSSLAGRIHYAFLGQVDSYVAISQDLGKEFLLAGFHSHKVVSMPNGVDTDRFRPTKGEEQKALRETLGLPADRPIALTIGVFDQRKNIGWLMEEWVKNNAFCTGALLLAVGPQSREDGDGTFIRSLQKLADGNPGLVRLMTYMEDIENCYRAADIFILPSHSEGMPNVILEAMASGLPCVATRVSGVQELIHDGRTGYVFTVGDAEAMGEVLVRVLKEREAIGFSARKYMELNYSIDSLARRYEELYSELTEGKGLGMKSSRSRNVNA